MQNISNDKPAGIMSGAQWHF